MIQRDAPIAKGNDAGAVLSDVALATTPDRIDLVLVLLGQGVALALGIWVLVRARPTTSVTA